MQQTFVVKNLVLTAYWKTKLILNCRQLFFLQLVYEKLLFIVPAISVGNLTSYKNYRNP